MPTDEPMLATDSVLGWELQAAKGTAAAASAYRSFGRVTEWGDLGPQWAVFRDHIAGDGPEASVVGFEGRTYQSTLGPFQVTDVKVPALWYGHEASNPVQIGATAYYTHTASPRPGRGALLSVHARDKHASTVSGAVTDKTTFIDTVVRRFALRGERVSDDGSGGRVMCALDLMALNSDATVADKTVTQPTDTPLKYDDGKITFLGEQVYRVLEWEIAGDANSVYGFYHQDSSSDRPYESSHQGRTYDFTASVVADGEKFSADGGTSETLHEAFVAKRKANASVELTRTASQDSCKLNLTDLTMMTAPKERSTTGDGRVVYRVSGIARASTYEWVDTNSAKFFT